MENRVNLLLGKDKEGKLVYFTALNNRSFFQLCELWVPNKEDLVEMAKDKVPCLHEEDVEKMMKEYDCTEKELALKWVENSDVTIWNGDIMPYDIRLFVNSKEVYLDSECKKELETTEIIEIFMHPEIVKEINNRKKDINWLLEVKKHTVNEEKDYIKRWIREQNDNVVEVI